VGVKGRRGAGDPGGGAPQPRTRVAWHPEAAPSTAEHAAAPYTPGSCLVNRQVVMGLLARAPARPPARPAPQAMMAGHPLCAPRSAGASGELGLHLASGDLLADFGLGRQARHASAEHGGLLSCCTAVPAPAHTLRPSRCRARLLTVSRGWWSACRHPWRCCWPSMEVTWAWTCSPGRACLCQVGHCAARTAAPASRIPAAWHGPGHWRCSQRGRVTRVSMAAPGWRRRRGHACMEHLMMPRQDENVQR
jgi:hypothetical protein